MEKAISPSDQQLTPDEKQIIRAARTGEFADFSSQKTRPLIRANVLVRLIVGLAQAGQKSVNPVTSRGLRIRHCQIEGELDLAGWSARADDPSRPLPSIEFSDCIFDNPVYLDECHLQGLELVLCTLPALFGQFAQINDPVRLNGSTISGADHKGGEGFFAILLDRAELAGGLFLRPSGKTRFRAHAQIKAHSAIFGGDFSAIGAHLQSKDGVVIDLFISTIRGSIFFVWRDEFLFRADGDILLVGIRVENGYMAASATMNGRVDLSHSHIGVLAEDPASGWPHQPGNVLLSGLTYDRLRVTAEHRQGDLAEQRLGWLKRQYQNPERPNLQEFDPQPFHQLASNLRQQGMGEDADQVSIEMRRLRLSAKIDPWYMRPVQHFLNLSCKFGYSGTRAVTSLFVWILIGSIMFAAHAFSGSFSPAEAVMMGRHDAGQNTHTTLLPFPPTPKHGDDLQSGWHQRVTRGCPGFVAPLYAVDVILPVIEFGQRRACAFDPQGPLAPMWRFLQLFYSLIGAILGAIAVVTLTGLLRRD